MEEALSASEREGLARYEDDPKQFQPESTDAFEDELAQACRQEGVKS